MILHISILRRTLRIEKSCAVLSTCSKLPLESLHSQLLVPNIHLFSITAFYCMCHDYVISLHFSSLLLCLNKNKDWNSASRSKVTQNPSKLKFLHWKKLLTPFLCFQLSSDAVIQVCIGRNTIVIEIVLVSYSSLHYLI